MSLCIELGCTACCSAMTHRKIPVSQINHLLGDEGYTYVDRPDKFDVASQVSIRPVVGSNGHTDPLKKFRDGNSSGEKRVNYTQPNDCRHLLTDTVGCGDYDNRAESCRTLIPGSQECVAIRKEKGL